MNGTGNQESGDRVHPGIGGDEESRQEQKSHGSGRSNRHSPQPARSIEIQEGEREHERLEYDAGVRRGPESDECKEIEASLPHRVTSQQDARRQKGEDDGSQEWKD